jgi:DNA-binding transcriptional MocR family regulator
MSDRREQARRLQQWRDMIWSSQLIADDPEGKAIAIVVALKVDWSTHTTVISNRTLSSLTSYSERTVSDRIRKLIRHGYLSARTVGHGRTWKLRELTLQWQVPGACHEKSRQAPDACHELPRHAGSSSQASTIRTEDRHQALPTSSETIKETSSERAASPAPANAVSTALQAKGDEVMRLYGDGLQPGAIAKRMRGDYGVMCNTTEVFRLIARRIGTS